MAQFEPKKLNIGEINGGNRFNNGDGVSAEAINAPIEAALYAEEIAKEAIGVKEQVQDHEERIAQTEYDTKMLYAIASQKGLYAVEEVEQAYTSRVTANGENIVDGQKTPVTMIKGSTVRDESTNTLKHARISGIVSTSGNLFNPALLDDYVVREGNWFYFNVNPVTVPQITLFDEPKNIYTKVKYKQFYENSNSRGVLFQFVKSDGSITEMSTYLNKDGESAVYIENVVGVKFSYGNQSINTIGDFIISTVDIPYTPYNKAIYQLPETLELPEFDSFNPQTGEIVRGTKELVLDGTENWFLRSNNVGNTQSFAFYLQDVTSTNLFVTNSTDLKETDYGGIVSDLNEAITVFQNVILVYAPSKFSTLDEWKAYLADLYAKGTPLTVEYQLATPTVEKIENAPKSYTAYNQGNETAVLENAEFGAIPTITNEYIVVL